MDKYGLGGGRTRVSINSFRLLSEYKNNAYERVASIILQFYRKILPIYNLLIIVSILPLKKRMYVCLLLQRFPVSLRQLLILRRDLLPDQGLLCSRPI